MANSSPLRGSEAPSAAHHAASRGAGARRGAVEPGSDTIWLTAGEAADAARVAHRQIAAWIETEELSARTGWRGGAEIRLVLLADLEALVESIDIDCIRGSLEARGVFTGPRHFLTGAAPRTPAPPGEAATPPDPTEPSAVAPDEWRAVDRPWAIELEQEIQRLREVITTLREDHESLERHLDTRVAVVSTRKLEVPGHSVVAGTPRGASSGGASSRSAFSGGALISTAGGLLLGLAGAAIATTLLRSTEDAVDLTPVVHAASRPATHSVAQDRSGPSVAGFSSALSTSPSTVEDELAPVEVATAEVERVATHLAPDLIAPPEPVSGAEGRARRAGLASRVTAVGSSVARKSPGAPVRLTPPMALAEIEPAIFSRNSAVLGDCAYTELLKESALNAGPAAALVLGPCFGPARPSAGLSDSGLSDSGLSSSGRDDSSDELAVPGTHRVGSVSCCRHHAFVERMTAASADDAARAGLRTEAEACMKEGVLPPLFRLRADRSASRFLREETRGWESAGLDGAAGGLNAPEAVHEWKLATAQPTGEGTDGIRVHLVSWLMPVAGLDRQLRAASGAGKDTPKLRRFRMTLLIQAAPRGDVLESFDWLTD
ncbi:hypothetical protein Poly30_26850 [Planctomycetes bacterium Poly30]|uniref:Uncharacterized protein n=1 Tax=Saltatorellus ferox TaxID=2528018 RepID=A0A518ESV2_9BACT|nr:hypothetical protein Poly30_26850 [Planctomycetes bacterium Poly30]